MGKFRKVRDYLNELDSILLEQDQQRREYETDPTASTLKVFDDYSKLKEGNFIVPTPANEVDIDLEASTEDALMYLNASPEELGGDLQERINKRQQALIDEQNKILADRKANELLDEQQKAFELQNAHYFEQDFTNAAVKAANEKFYEQNPGLQSLRGSSTTPKSNDSSAKIKETDDLGVPYDTTVDNLNGSFFGNLIAQLASISGSTLGTFSSLGTSFRFPTFNTYIDTDALLQNNPFVAGAALPKLFDAAVSPINRLLDEAKLEELNSRMGITSDGNLLGKLQLNPIASYFMDEAAKLQETSAGFKYTNKTLANDGWEVFSDGGYLADVTASIVGSMTPMLITGAGIGAASKTAGLSNNMSSLLGSIVMTTTESTQIADDTARKVFRSTLDNFTDGKFSAGEKLYLDQVIEDIKNSGSRLSDSEFKNKITQAKNDYLKQYAQENPDVVATANESAVTAYSQAASFNSINVLTNLSGMNLLVNGFAREAAKRPLAAIGSSLFFESAQEFYEEGVTNRFAELSGTAKAAGKKYYAASDVASDIYNTIVGNKPVYSDATKDLFSLQTLEEGIAGALGGFGMSTFGSIANYSTLNKDYKEYREMLNRYHSVDTKVQPNENYIARTAIALSHKSDVDSYMQDYNKAMQTFNDTGNDIPLKLLEASLLVDQVYNANKLGTTKELNGMYTKLLNSDNITTEDAARIKDTLSTIQEIQKNIDSYHNTGLRNIKQLALYDIAIKQLRESAVAKDAAALDSYRTIQDLFAEQNLIVSDDIISNKYAPDTVEHDAYNAILKNNLTTNNDFIDYIVNRNLKNKAIKQAGIYVADRAKAASEEHQKMLKTEENLALDLKTLRGSYLPELNKFSKALSKTASFLKLGKSIKDSDTFNKAVDKVVDTYLNNTSSKPNKVKDVFVQPTTANNTYTKEDEKRLRLLAEHFKIYPGRTAAEQAAAIAAINNAIAANLTNPPATPPAANPPATPSATDTTYTAPAVDTPIDTAPVTDTTPAIEDNTEPTSVVEVAIPEIVVNNLGTDTELEQEAVQETVDSIRVVEQLISRTSATTVPIVFYEAISMAEGEYMHATDILDSYILTIEDALNIIHFYEQGLVDDSNSVSEALKTQKTNYINLLAKVKALKETYIIRLGNLQKLKASIDAVTVAKSEDYLELQDNQEINSESKNNIERLLAELFETVTKFKTELNVKELQEINTEFTSYNTLFTKIAEKSQASIDNPISDLEIPLQEERFQSSIRTLAIPYSGMLQTKVEDGKLVYVPLDNANKKYYNELLKRFNDDETTIPEAYNNFVADISDHNIAIDEKLLSFEVDAYFLRALGFKERRVLVANLLERAIAGENINWSEHLSDEEILKLPIKVKLSETSYTYMVDSNYFAVTKIAVDPDTKQYIRIFNDGTKMEASEFAAYKQKVLEERKTILNNLKITARIDGRTAGSLQLVDVNNKPITNTVEGITPDSTVFIKVGNIIKPSATNLLASSDFHSGDILIESIGANGRKSLVKITPRTLNENEAFALLSIAKHILANTDNLAAPINITDKNGNILISGLDALTALNLLTNKLDGSSENSVTPKLLEQLQEIVKLETELGYINAINTLKTYTLPVSVNGINKTMAEAIKAISNSKAIADRNLNFFGISLEDKYNKLVFSNTTSPMSSIYRIKPQLIYKFNIPNSNNLITENFIEPDTAPAINNTDDASIRAILDLLNGEGTDNAIFSSAETLEELEDDGTIAKQLNWLKENLPQLPAEEYDTIIPLINDKIALGYFFTNLETITGRTSWGIRYSRRQPTKRKGIIYHEAFHGVLAVLLSEKEHKDIISKFDEEYLAEAFRRYLSTGERFKDPDVQTLFDRIINYILTFLHLSNEYKINKLFSDIATGRYKHAKVRTDRIVSSTKAYSTAAPISALVAKEAAKSLVSAALNTSSYEVITEITSAQISARLRTELLKVMEGGNKEAIETLATFASNYILIAGDTNNIVVQEANNYLKKLLREDIKNAVEAGAENESSEDVEYTPNDFEESEGNDSGEISKHIADTSLFDYTLKAPKFVQVLIAALPKLDINGKPVYNKLTGMREPVDYRQTHTVLLEVLQGSFNDILDTAEKEYTEDNLAATKVLKGLQKLSIHKPELLQLYKFLVNPADTEDIKDFKKTMFYSAMALNRVRYLTGTIKNISEDIDDASTGTTYTVESVQFRPYIHAPAAEEMINSWLSESQWAKTFTDNNVLNDTFRDLVIYTKKFLENLENETNAVTNKYYTNQNDRKFIQDRYEILINAALKYFNDKLKLPVNRQTIDYLVDLNSEDAITLDSNNNKIYTFSNYVQLKTLLLQSTKPFVTSSNISNKDVILSLADAYVKRNGAITKSELRQAFISTFGELAQHAFLFSKHKGSSTLKSGNNKTVYVFDYQSHIQNIFNFLRTNTQAAQDYANKLANKIEHSNSIYLTNILNKKINISRLLALSQVDEVGERRNNTGTDVDFASDLLFNLQFVVNGIANKNFNAHIRMLSFADKATSDLFYQVPSDLLRNAFTSNINERLLNPEVIDIFYNYYLSELERILDTEDSGYNYIEANKLKSFLFEEAPLPEVAIEEARARKEITKDNLRSIIDNIPSVKESVKKSLLTYIDDEITKFKDIVDANVLEDLKTKIDTNIIRYYTKTYQTGALDAMIADFIINSTIANIETTKLFTGSVASYQSVPNFLKRTPFITSKGQQAKVTNTETKFNLALVKTEKQASKIYTKETIEAFRPLIEKQRLAFIKEKFNRNTLNVEDNKYIDDTIDRLYNSYTSLDTTDAQGYITLDRWYDLIKGSYKYNKNVDDLYNKLAAGNATFEDFEKANTFLQPLKGIIHELNLDGRYAIPVDIKYSQLILTPQLIKGTPKLQELYDKMIANKVDEIVFDSGSKGDFIEINDLNSTELKHISLNKWSWKLQVDFTAKNYKVQDSLVGSQFVKNVWLNTRLDDIYADGKTGRQLVSEITEIINILSNRKAKLFYEEGLSNFISVIDDISVTQRNLLERGADPSMFPQSFGLVETSINSKIRKQITTLKMKGGAYIQASPKFFTEEVDINDSNIHWLIDKAELDGSTVDKSAYVLLPYNIIKDLTEEQINNLTTTDIDIRLLEGIGYRIPNQPKASIDKIRIAGFLSKGYGDTIIVYNEGTKKFGYDFDVDKKYVLFPEGIYNPETNKLEYVESSVVELDNVNNAVLKNRLIKNWQTLINGHLNEIIEPLDDSWLERIIRENNPKESYNGLILFSPITQIQIKRNNVLAKDLIGPFANMSSDMQSNQYGKVYLPFELGIGNKTEDGFIDLSQQFDNEGNLLSNTALAFQNAAVDAAKNPFIIQGNITLETADITVLLIKAGVSRDFIVKLMAHPVFKEYTSLQNRGYTPFKAIDKIATRYGTVTDSLKELAVKTAELFETGQSPNNVTAISLLVALKRIAELDTMQTLVSKIGVSGGGKTMAEKIVLMEKIRYLFQLTPEQYGLFEDLLLYPSNTNAHNLQLLNKQSLVGNLIYKFIDIYNNNKLTLLGNDYKNSIGLLKLNFGKELLPLSTEFTTFNVQIHNQMGRIFATNKNTVKAALNAFYNYVFFNSFRDPDFNLNAALNPVTGLAARIIEEKKVNEAFANTYLANAFSFDSDSKYNIVFINADNKKNKEIRADIIDEFEKALNGVYGDVVKAIAADLVQYSLHTDTTYSLKSFFHLLPPNAFIDDYYIKSAQNKEVRQLDKNVNRDTLVEQFFRNNWLDNTIVPIVRSSELSKKSVTLNGVIRPFVKIKNKKSPEKFKLLKLVRYDDNSAIYEETSPMGYYSEVGTIKQYGDNINNRVILNTPITLIEPLVINQSPNFKKYEITLARTQNPFSGKLLYVMPGLGKTSVISKLNTVVEPEPYYKELLGNDNILEGLKSHSNAEVAAIQQKVADWVKQKLAEGYTVISGLKFLLDDSAKYNLIYNYVVVHDNHLSFRNNVYDRGKDSILFSIAPTSFTNAWTDNITFTTSNVPGYTTRTKENVVSTDVTMAIAFGLTPDMLDKSKKELNLLRLQQPDNQNIPSAGEKDTYDYAKEAGKLYIPLDASSLEVTETKVNKIVEKLNSLHSYNWAKVSNNNYEVSSLGDTRFSALFATLKDGRTIEQAWAEAKGYRSTAEAKNKPAKFPDFKYWETYKGLWEQWAAENPALMNELATKAKGKILTDSFANTENNQARALSEILNEQESNEIALNIAGNGIYTLAGKYTQKDLDNFVYKLLEAVMSSPDLKVKIGSVRTGGQTGFDEAGAKAAAKLGLPVIVHTTLDWKYRNAAKQDVSNEKSFKARFLSNSDIKLPDGDILDNVAYLQKFNSYITAATDMERRQFNLFNTPIEKIVLSQGQYLENLLTGTLQYKGDSKNSENTKNKCNNGL